jgi:bisphosphoglycerate-dependent phosphoglycerate mutase
MNGMSTGTLVLLRHGESEWNALNLFTGWVDVHLTDKGIAEGKRAGELLREHDLLPDVSYTSLLRRAISTANIALDAADRHWIPVVRDWRLNERHYGALQGRNKAQVKDKYGDEQFMLWRRSYDTPPPPIDAGSGTRDSARYPSPSASSTSSSASSRTGKTRSPPTCWRARPSSSPPTATRSEPWSSTSTASPTTPSPGSTFRQGSRCVTTWTRT